uniref:Calcium-activated potassium channel subunit beta-2 n=1 Tax=Lygus hesperus TaxID=30085 RepID=A0A0A9Z6T2_LYGHE
MPKQKKIPIEDLVVPPQNTKICGTICMCQMTAVLSCVALVYLSVAIYMPYMRAFQSGMVSDPVMCTTTRAVTTDSCDWGSCGEWCLSKTSGSCIQIYVNLRRNGSTIHLANCTNTANKTCYGIDQENAKKYRCIADECRNLTGTFNCTLGMCINITDAFECIFKNVDPPLKCSGRRGKINCIEMDGLQNCVRGTCERIRTPYNCDRRCLDIPTRNKNSILLSGDKVYLSQCQRAFVTGTSTGTDIEIWNDSQNNILMMSCYNIENTSDTIDAVDCINGTLLDKTLLSDLTNFTYLSYLSVTNTKLLDDTGVVAPPEIDLLIANESKLLINMEGCVNTLRDECKEFLREYGKDGTDHGARGRFPCFYAEQNVDVVVARFNLEATYKEFLLASIVPSVLFVVSCLTLIICQRTIEVGDDSKMRIKKKSSIITAKKDDKENAEGDTGGGDHAMAL